jgi:hypothetical protein
VFLKAREIFTKDSDKITIDKLNRNFDVFKSGGPIGPLGIYGIPGVLGTQGIQGVQGVQGITGPQGVAGTTNTKWDMDKVLDSNLVDLERILRPLNLGQFSSRILMGETGIVFGGTIDPPSYEPQALISFIFSDQPGGTGKMIEFPYIDANGVIDSDFVISYRNGTPPPNPFQTGTLTTLNIGDQRNTPGGGNFKIEGIQTLEFLSDSIFIEGSNNITINASTDLNISADREHNITSTGGDVITSSVENSSYKTEGFNRPIYIDSVGEIRIDSATLLSNNKKILVKAENSTVFIETLLLRSSSNIVDFNFTDTSKINSNITEIDSNALSSLNITESTGIYSLGGLVTISTNKFYSNISNLISAQTILFSDIDGDNTGRDDFENTMSTQLLFSAGNTVPNIAGGLTTGDGILFKEGEDEDPGVDYAAPNFGTEERDRTLADSFTYVSQEAQGVGGEFLFLKGTPNYNLQDVFGIGQDIFNIAPVYEKLNDWQVPSLNSAGTYYEFTENKSQLSYVKTGDLINAQGFVIGESSDGNHYSGGPVGPPVNTHNFAIPINNANLDDIIALKIASPDKFPYVNSSNVPIMVDINLAFIDSIMEPNSALTWSPFQSGPGNVGTPGFEYVFGLSTTGLGDNSGIVGVIPPGENKIFLYVEGWREAWRSSTINTFVGQIPGAIDAVSMAKYPLTLRTLGTFRSDSSYQSMLTESDKYIFRYSFKMPSDWNSYNKTRGVSSIQWGNTGYSNPGGGMKNIEKGNDLVLKINYSGPSEYDWSYKIIYSSTGTSSTQYNLVTSGFNIDDIIDTANVVADRTSTQNTLTIPVKSGASTNHKFRVIVTNSYTGESIMQTFNIVIASANSTVGLPNTGGASGGSTTATTGSGATNTNTAKTGGG